MLTLTIIIIILTLTIVIKIFTIIIITTVAWLVKNNEEIHVIGSLTTYFKLMCPMSIDTKDVASFGSLEMCRYFVFFIDF